MSPLTFVLKVSVKHFCYSVCPNKFFSSHCREPVQADDPEDAGDVAGAEVAEPGTPPPPPPKKKRGETPIDRLIEKINEMEEKREARHQRRMDLLERLVAAYEKKSE